MLLSEQQIKEINKKLAEQINSDYKGKKLLLVSVLKGAVVFLSDLMREIDLPCTIDFMIVSSYGSGIKTSGVVKIIKDLDTNLEGFDVFNC